VLDSHLIDYLQSGTAWLLVGSGPSTEMGYPDWEQLAENTLGILKSECVGVDFSAADKALREKDFPEVFQEVWDIVGGQRIRQIISGHLYPARSGRIYELIAKWPINVYLTTNYDDAIHDHLTRIGESYRVLSNSENHIGMLHPNLTNAVIKLHGDMTSDEGLILTSNQYKEILEEEKWAYWRIKMMSVFQMCPLIILGHSLSDINIQGILSLAKKGASVDRPICWIAPNVSQQECIKFLEEYRIRVIPYDDDESHNSLVRMVETITDYFVPPRISIPMIQQIRNVYQQGIEPDAAAAGFFVFNKFCEQKDLELIQAEIMVAALQSAVTKMKAMGEFTLEDSLQLVGWPTGQPISIELKNAIKTHAAEKGLLKQVENERFVIGDNAERLSSENRERFNHLKGRFIDSVKIRIKRKFPALESDAEGMATDMENAMIGYFKEIGLTLASMLSADTHSQRQLIPRSILAFLNLVAAKYDVWLKRQAFTTVSLDVFKQAGSSEREYLGRISRGFYAFHALGVLGDVARERLKQAKEAVWLIDSNVQITALALANIGNYLVRDCFLKSKERGIRFYTTDKLLQETVQHLRYADGVVREHGASSYYVMAAARGNSPYKKQNEFLSAFIRWQHAGNRSDWGSYLYRLFNSMKVDMDSVKNSLRDIGIETVCLQDWPGFVEDDYHAIEERIELIKETAASIRKQFEQADEDILSEAHRKAVPEGEASIIIKKERRGDYYVHSIPGTKSDAWFISKTSILNLLDKGEASITWQPRSFFSFASTICTETESKEADKAFEAILLSVSESGVDLLDDETLGQVFGGIIDQASLSIGEERDKYARAIETKYGESPDSIMAKIAAPDRPMAALQLANEAAQLESERRKKAEELSADAVKRAASAEKELASVKRFRLKWLRKQSQRKKKTVKGKKKRKGKKGKKR
jgi:hypothetical protein